MKKLYGLNISSDMVDFFEEQLVKHDVELINRDLQFDSEWNPIYRYTLRAKEGIINPQFEVILPKVEV